MYNNAPQSGLASLIQAQGRGDDTMLVHMTPGEVQALQGIANAAGGSLSLNPNTGLPEAGFLKELLPTIAGGLLKTVFPGMGELGIGLITAGVTGLIKGDLEKGLTAGMGAYSGAKLASGISQIGREQIATKEALAKRGAEQVREATAEELGLTPKALTASMRPLSSVGIGQVRTATELPSIITPEGIVSTPYTQARSPAGIRPSYVPYDRAKEDIQKSVQDALAASATERPTRSEFGEGIKALFRPGGLERFQTAMGGPKQAGFVISPILGALQAAEQEKARKKFARSQTPNYYYVPGKFDFESGTFAPGGYYTAPGQPYTPKTGFAGGGVVFQEGGETGTAALEQYYQGLLTPPDTSMGEARRAETMGYLSALNQQLRGTPPDTGIAPPGSGGTDIVGTPGGGSSTGNQGQPIGPGLPGGQPPVDMGGPLIGFDPSAGVGLPGQTLNEFLRDARTSTEQPVEKTEPTEEKTEDKAEEPSQLRETVGNIGSAVTGITDPLLNLYDKLPDYLRNLAPGYTLTKLVDEAAEKAKEYGIQIPAAPQLEQSPIEMQEPTPIVVEPPDPFLMDLLRNLEKSPEDKEGKIIIEDISMPGDITQGGTFDPGSVIKPDVGAPSWMDSPYNPLEQNPLGGRGVGLNQQGLGGFSGAMGPDYNFGFAQGGLTGLPEYQAGGKLLRGPGDGMSDDIKANIDGQQEARLADGEFVVPADVVSHLGNGSTDAGAKKLYAMMDRVRKARTGSTKQGREINPNKFLPA